jgi:hypothetical protein
MQLPLAPLDGLEPVAPETEDGVTSRTLLNTELHLSADDSRLQMAPDESVSSLLAASVMSGTYRFTSSRTLIRELGAQRMSRT